MPDISTIVVIIIAVISLLIPFATGRLIEKLVIDNAYWNPLRFRLVFGFNPRSQWNDWSLKTLRQRQVNLVLNKKAYDFLTVCSWQQGLDEKVRLATNKELTELVVEAKSLRKLLRKRKQEFWRAHTLAGMFSYEVERRASDYATGYCNTPEGQPIPWQDLVPAARH